MNITFTYSVLSHVNIEAISVILGRENVMYITYSVLIRITIEAMSMIMGREKCYIHYIFSTY